MANRHFAKVGDVWKHLPLVEILAVDRPKRYWESHAGSAVYQMVDDAERRYGVRHFAAAAPRFADLAASRYLDHVTSLNEPHGSIVRYPGSAMLAMLELGASCSYLFCDLDPASVADLHAAGARLGLPAQVDVRRRDGMTELREALASVPAGESLLTHVDPYDPWATGSSGLSALDLAAVLVETGTGLVYWYGYDRPEDRGWALAELGRRAPTRFLWAGDMMVTSDTDTPRGGHFGSATTPGTGCGVVCANISPRAVAACRGLGEQTAAAYAGAVLPDGTRGRLDFAARTTGSPPDGPGPWTA